MEDVIENRLVFFFLKWTFRNTAKAWASKKVSEWYYIENQGEKYILSTKFLLAILVSGLNTQAGEGLTSWRGVQPFLSVPLIWSNTGKGLTYWKGVQTFLSVALICSNTGEGLTR